MGRYEPPGTRSLYGKHYPGGQKKGVRRGTLHGGSISYNGHFHIREETRKLVLGFLGDLRRVTTAQEVSAQIGYSIGYVQNLLRALAADGDVTRTPPGRRGYPVLYGLPETYGADPTERRKACSKCGKDLPLSAFGRDRSQPSGIRPDCKRCRAPHPDRYRGNKAGREVTS